LISATGSILLVVWLLAATVSFYTVSDVFSPEKLILIALGMFFGDVFFNDYSLEFNLVYVAILTSFVAVVVLLSPILRRNMKSLASASSLEMHHKSNDLLIGYKFFWLLSIPALLAQVWMIQLFGGIEGYINVLAMRVVEFRGLGWLTSIIKTFSVINLVYFSYLVTRSRRKRRDVAIYMLHFGLFLFMGLLTGSRGSLLVNPVLMLLIYHHSVQRISLRWLSAFALSAVLLASVLELARQGVSFGEGGLVTGLSAERQDDRKMSFRWAQYGTIPLNLVLDENNASKQYGFTYLTVITNFVPRVIWPTKPDTGGIVLTKEYTDNAWGGSSNLSTGIFPEAIINFGQPLGVIVGTLQFCALVGGLLLYYVRFRRRKLVNNRYQFVYSVRFAYISWAAMALIVGEFTNTMITLLIQLITVSVIGIFLHLFSKTRMSRLQVTQ